MNPTRLLLKPCFTVLRYWLPRFVAGSLVLIGISGWNSFAAMVIVSIFSGAAAFSWYWQQRPLLIHLPVSRKLMAKWIWLAWILCPTLLIAVPHALLVLLRILFSEDEYGIVHGNIEVAALNVNCLLLLPLMLLLKAQRTVPQLLFIIGLLACIGYFCVVSFLLLTGGLEEAESSQMLYLPTIAGVAMLTLAWMFRERLIDIAFHGKTASPERHNFRGKGFESRLKVMLWLMASHYAPLLSGFLLYCSFSYPLSGLGNFQNWLKDLLISSLFILSLFPLVSMSTLRPHWRSLLTLPVSKRRWLWAADIYWVILLLPAVSSLTLASILNPDLWTSFQEFVNVGFVVAALCVGPTFLAVDLVNSQVLKTGVIAAFIFLAAIIGTSGVSISTIVVLILIWSAGHIMLRRILMNMRPPVNCGEIS